MSVKNKVRELRRKAGLSQKKLAEKTNISVWQLQMAEAGLWTRLQVAADISNALNKSTDLVFPQLRGPLKKLQEGDPSRLLTDEKLRRQFEAANIDPDPHVHTFRFVLSSGFHKDVEIPSSERSRLWANLHSPDSIFVWFDTIADRIAVNVTRLAFWQFLSDLGGSGEDPESDREGGLRIKLWLGSSVEPWLLDVEPDPVEFGTEEADSLAVLQGLFFDLEHCWEPTDTFRIDDEDGETAFFRAENVSMLLAPLQAVDPALWESMTEEEDEATPGL